MKIKHLKINQEYFKAVVKGLKTFELRFNDRDYHVGDILCLEEYKNEYTGNYIHIEVIYMLEDERYLQKNYVALGIKNRLDLNANLNSTYL